MASLRLKLATDPRINDRVNHRDDDPELVELLACGPGLLGLDAARLRDAALGLGPERPLAAIEFVEVAWRAGRLGDAVTIMEALLAVTPKQPAYAQQRVLLDMYDATLRMEAAATVADDAWSEHALVAREAVLLLTSDADSEHIKRLLASVEATWNFGA